MASGPLSQTQLRGRPAYYEHHQLALRPTAQAESFKRLDLLLLLPERDFRGSVVLFLNKCGNHTLLPDPEIPIGPAPRTAACRTAGRAWRASFWGVKTALESGLGLLSVHESQIAPDEVQAYHKALNSWPEELLQPSSPPGLLSLWSWGLSAVYDYAYSDLHGVIQHAEQLGVFGHSRRGKTALLTAALDRRVDFVLAHQSGTLGAVDVQDRPAESLASITRSFPHWFTAYAARYAGQPEQLPVEAGSLLKLIAPRPVLLSDGDFDFWASPREAHRNLERALPFYKLYASQDPSLNWKAQSWQRGEAEWWRRTADVKPLPVGHLHLATWHTMSRAYWPPMAEFVRAQWEPYQWGSSGS